MADSRNAWDRVGQDFTELGQHLKRQYERHYQRQPGAGQRPPEDRHKLEAAVRQFTDSLDQVFTALGDAIRDPDFGEQTKKTASSLSDALSSTFAEVSQRFRSKPEEDHRPPGGGSETG
jgi:Flp pilus assembly pilin Flp